MWMYWRLAARNLLQARRRTLLLSAALGTVSMFMVLLMTLSQGIGDTLIRSATVLVTGHVNVAGFYKTQPSNAATVVAPTGDIRHAIHEALPDVAQIIDRSRGWGKVTSPQGSLEAMLSGVDIAQEKRLLDFLQIAEERDYLVGGGDKRFGDAGGLLQPHSALLFAAQAKRLGVRVGDMLTVSVETLGGVQNTDEVEVVAIARDAGYLSNRNMFLNKDSLRALFQLNGDATGLVMVYLNSIAKAPQAMDTLRRALLAQGFHVLAHDTGTWRQKIETVKSEDWTGQRLDLTTWQDELGNTMWILTTLNSLTVLFIAILTLIVVAGIINTMWIAVRERTQEVGMLRAIGMSRRRVLGMFMAEATLLGSCASTLGSLLGAGIAYSINALHYHVPLDAVQTVLMSDVVQLTIQSRQLVHTILLFTFFTTGAALWPALRATRLQPLTAIQKVG